MSGSDIAPCNKIDKPLVVYRSDIVTCTFRNEVQYNVGLKDDKKLMFSHQECDV